MAQEYINVDLQHFTNLVGVGGLDQDEGAVGAMMQLCHKKLDENNYITKLNKNSIILEIGADTSPHIKYLMHDFKKYIFLE